MAKSIFGSVRHTAAAIAALLAAGAVPALASPDLRLTGVVQGTWSEPLLSGQLVDGQTGASSPRDNTGSAACSISGCPNQLTGFGADTLVWGRNAGSSSLNINGHFFSDVPLNTVFDAAEISYSNGTSALDSLIFGATLTLRFLRPFGEVGPDVADPKIMFVNITTTNNTGTGAQNADFVGPFGTVVPLTFNALENAPTAHAELFGMFVGDPQFQPTLLVSTDQNGFIGQGRPTGTPEPASLAVLLTGLGALAWPGRRRSRD